MTKKKNDYSFENSQEILNVSENIQEEVKDVKSENYITVCALNVRNTPEKTDNVVRILSKDECVEVIEDLGEWCKIGEDEYVMKEFISKV